MFKYRVWPAGVFRWPDGSSYDGEWRQDQPHGRGVSRLADGSVYVGGWAGGQRHGRGNVTTGHRNAETYLHNRTRG